MSRSASSMAGSASTAVSEARWFDRLVVRPLRYDNRTDPTAENYASGATPWRTTFDAVGARFESGTGWTAIAQALKGETRIVPDGFVLDWPFKAQYALIARQVGRNTFSARYDRFEVDTNANAAGNGAESGHAWTVAYVFARDEHWRFTLEWLRVTSNSYYRDDVFGLAAFARETQLQLAVRYALGSSVY